LLSLVRGTDRNVHAVNLCLPLQNSQWTLSIFLLIATGDFTRMCGIVGYTGKREATPILLKGLSRLEYRGYDSAGIATVSGSNLKIRKCVGRVPNLAALVERQPAAGFSGISHTRWATHGGATNVNAHPHLGGDGCVAVVHNGVIENFDILKCQL